MANGKISYTPIQTRALVLDGAHYANLDQAAFNVGTGHFGFDWLGQIDADTPDNLITIIRKSPTNWANTAGWWFGAEKDRRRLRLILNDGQAGKIDIYSADNAFPLGSRFYGAVRADRAGEARFFVGLPGQAAAAVGSGAISSRAGSLDNTYLLRVGGYSTAADRLKGAIDLLRVDSGRLLPDSWYQEEWDRLRFGCRRLHHDFLACWLFGGSLADASASAYTLAWQGGGAAAYADGWPYSAAPLTYNFEENYSHGFEAGYLDLDDRQRAADGSDFTDAGPEKLYYKLSFNNLPVSQQAAFTAAWQARQSFRFFPDGAKPSPGWFKFETPPAFVNQFLERAKADISLEQT